MSVNHSCLVIICLFQFNIYQKVFHQFKFESSEWSLPNKNGNAFTVIILFHNCSIRTCILL